MRTILATVAICSVSFVATETAAAAATDSARRVGILAVGGDSTAAGDLQRELEVRLASSPRATFRGANELAAALGRTVGATAPSGPDSQTLKEAAELLQKASDAYYQDRSAIALERLGALSTLHEKTGNFPASERVRLLLWRTAVFLALKDTTQAESEALAALTLSPELKVDINEFRPSVRDMVEKVRAHGLRNVTVLVTGLPAGAQLRVDDRLVAPRFTVPIGRHRLFAAAPGRRDVSRAFETAGDLSIPMTLPLSIDPALEAALAGIVWRGQATAADAQGLSSLALRLGVDWLLVAAIRNEPSPESRVALISLVNGNDVSASAPMAIGAGTNASLAAFAETRVSSGFASGPIATPTPTPVVVAVAVATPPSRERPPRQVPSHASRSRSFAEDSTTTTTADGAMVWQDSQRTVAGNGQRYATAFGGIGPRLTVDVSHDAFFGEVEASWITYSISSLEVSLPDNSTRTVGGGSTLAARVAGGWRHAFGSGDFDDSPVIRAGFGVAHESHSAQDVTGTSNQRLHVLNSYALNVIQARVDGRIPLPGSTRRPAITVGVSVGPVVGFTENPAHASGKSPASNPEVSAHAGASFSPTGKMELGLDLLGAMRQTTFKGPAAIATVPIISDAKVSESFFGAAVTARYRF